MEGDREAKIRALEERIRGDNRGFSVAHELACAAYMMIEHIDVLIRESNDAHRARRGRAR